jgi:predicted nucleotidyltransferase
MRNQTSRLISQIVPILKKYQVKRASLFGFYARGEQTGKSDVDIVVNLAKGKSLIDLIFLKQDLEAKLNKAVDLTTFNSLHSLVKENSSQDQIAVL